MNNDMAYSAALFHRIQFLRVVYDDNYVCPVTFIYFITRTLL